MKTLLISAKSKENIMPVVIKSLRLLPKKIGLITTIQFVDQLPKVKKFLESKNKKVVIGGQILGCNVKSAEKIDKKIDAFFYIGSGYFHPIAVKLATNKEVIIANPLENSVSKVNEADIKRLKAKKKTALIKFYSAKNIGILVTTKPGQQYLKKATELKAKLKDKQCYIFISDTIDLNDLENYPFIDSWVNTACPRLSDYSSNIINIEEL